MRWNKEDSELLKKVYATADKEKLISLFPNFTYDNILKKASKLGLGGQKKEKWSEEDVEKLKRLYPYMDYKTICKELKRTEGQVKSKAKQLGLKRDLQAKKQHQIKVNTWSEEEDKILYLYFPEYGIEKCVEELPTRTKKSIQARLKKLSIKRELGTRGIWTKVDEKANESTIKKSITVIYKRV